jgi:alpha-tubulin suppressor-like RCC1 family protein
MTPPHFSAAVYTFSVLANPNYYSAVGAWGSDLESECDVPLGIQNPVSVAAGAFHNVVLQADGTVIAWGKNWDGQTNVPGGTTNVVAIAAGSDHSLALVADGSLIAWGRNADGQTNVPLSATNLAAIAAGWAHSLALRNDGTVIAWGNNDYGQTNVPQNLSDVVAIAAGYYHNLALRADHSIVAWGSQYTVPASVSNAVAIAAGWEHSLALTADGHVVAWGDNSYGQCNVPLFVTNANAIKAGYGLSMARLNNGSLVAWGRNYFGTTNVPSGLANVASLSCGEDHELAMVGYGSPQVQWETKPIVSHVGGNALLKANIAGTFPIACQWYHGSTPVAGATNAWLQLENVQISAAGTYYLLASNLVSQAASTASSLRIDSSPYFVSPQPATQNSLVGTALSLGVTAIGAQPLSLQAQLNSVNLADDSRVSGTDSSSLCFDPTAFADSGALTLIITNNFGSYTGLVANLSVTPIIGWGSNASGQITIPATVTNVVSLASGGDHNLALLNNGIVAAWGDNSYNQNNVPGFLNQVVAVAEGDSHSLALEADGTVVAWGNSSVGQTNVPVGAQGAVALAAGAGFSQAVMPDGSIVEWGAAPILPVSFTNVMFLSTKGSHSLALRADGTVVETGINSVSIPLSCTNVIAICAGRSDSLVLRPDGSLIAWGKNLYGQTNIPASATNVSAITAGDDHFAAVRADGKVIAWGSTNFSQTLVPTITQSIGPIAAGAVHTIAGLGQPLQRALVAGASTSLSAGQFANRLATFQWQFNGTDIAGATNSTLTISNVFWMNSGLYRVVISNPVGIITSPAMSLSVPPLAFAVPDRSGILTNGSIALSLNGASGLYPITIYMSTNLSDWTPVLTNSPTTNVIHYIGAPLEGSPGLYYRAVEQP